METYQFVIVLSPPPPILLFPLSIQHYGKRVWSTKHGETAPRIPVPNTLLFITLPLSQRIQLPPFPTRIAARKLPPRPVHAPTHIHQAPAHRSRHGRPIRPQAVLILSIEIEQEKRDDVEGPSLHDRLLAPRFEHGGCVFRVGAVRRWCGRVLCKGGNGADFAVEMRAKGLLEQGHYRLQLRAVEGARRAGYAV